ncbi:MAG: hypothetical protein ACKOXB_01235 [Flavobacteriales bacterium]
MKFKITVVVFSLFLIACTSNPNEKIVGKWKIVNVVHADGSKVFKFDPKWKVHPPISALSGEAFKDLFIYDGSINRLVEFRSDSLVESNAIIFDKTDYILNEKDSIIINHKAPTGELLGFISGKIMNFQERSFDLQLDSMYVLKLEKQ